MAVKSINQPREYPKWKYTVTDGEWRATLVGDVRVEAELGAAWSPDPFEVAEKHKLEIGPCGGPADASGRVAFGPVPVVPGVTNARVGR